MNYNPAFHGAYDAGYMYAEEGDTYEQALAYFKTQSLKEFGPVTEEEEIAFKCGFDECLEASKPI